MVRINYARGGVVIELGEDNFYFGGLLISEQQFGVIIREKGLFSSASYDGIMGLSYPSLSEHTKPVFDRIIEMNKLKKNIFSFYLGRGGVSDKSKFALGGYNEKYIKGKLQWHPVIRKTWWTLKLDAVLLNGKDTELCNDKTKCEVIMDTGSSLMATPPWALNPFLSKLRSFSNCHDIGKFPTVTYVINGEKYSLEPYEYILSAGNTLRYDKNETSGVCGFGYSIFDVGKKNVWIAGDIFLSKYFSVYDRDNNRVGLALANHNH